jgi:hypothetical protein
LKLLLPTAAFSLFLLLLLLLLFRLLFQLLLLLTWCLRLDAFAHARRRVMWRFSTTAAPGM